MSLIPYTSREGREIVLRHQDALVVRDPASQRLEVRGRAPLRECPTCHQPLRRQSSPERHFDIPPQHESYVDPNYFRMLQAGHLHQDESPQGPPSPIRRIIRPSLPSGGVFDDENEAEFISSDPAPREGARIRRDAFSPNYFRNFFKEERELGRGGKGVVLLVRHVLDGCTLGYFACKRVPVGDDHAWLEKVLIEVELLAKLSHPNLVSYRHVWLEDMQLHRFGPSVACAFILQQYCNSGDLLQYVVGEQPKQATKEQLKERMRRRSKGQSDQPQDFSAAQRRLSLEEIYSLFKDITSGLAYLHSANYIHRDLKPSNCLLHHENGKLTCLISDFGEVQPGNAIRKSTGTTGTISYCAPEVLKVGPEGHFGNFTTKSDVFSLGMILYFLCFGRLPYQNANMVQEELEDIDLLRAEISDWQGFKDEQRERPDLPSQLYFLLKKMLSLNPLDRPSASEVLTVMGHETTNGGLRNRQRNTSPPISLHSRRVQNLDSPIVPGTPVPEPSKQLRTESPAENDDYSEPPVGLSHSMTLSRSQEGFGRSSPSRLDAARLLPPQSSPNMLPAPPADTDHSFKSRALQTLQAAANMLPVHSDSLWFLTRLALFMVKVVTLARPCWPFTVNVEAAVPIVGLAALDLGMPLHRGPWGWEATLLLLMLHFLALWVVSRWGTLCASAGDVWVNNW